MGSFLSFLAQQGPGRGPNWLPKGTQHGTKIVPKSDQKSMEKKMRKKMQHKTETAPPETQKSLKFARKINENQKNARPLFGRFLAPKSSQNGTPKPSQNHQKTHQKKEQKKTRKKTPKRLPNRPKMAPQNDPKSIKNRSQKIW